MIIYVLLRVKFAGDLKLFASFLDESIVDKSIMNDYYYLVGDVNSFKSPDLFLGFFSDRVKRLV